VPGAVVFSPGDYRRGCVVAIPVKTRAGIVSHKGILGDVRGADGFPTVIHNAKAFGSKVVETTMTDFASHGLGPITCEGFPGEGKLSPDEVLARARAMIGAPWRFRHNCEHFVGAVHGDEDPASPQFQAKMKNAAGTVVLGGAVAAVTYLGFRRARE
jgi:hypothetical protein